MSCLNGAYSRFLRSFYICTPCLHKLSPYALPAGALPASIFRQPARRHYATQDAGKEAQAAPATATRVRSRRRSKLSSRQRNPLNRRSSSDLPAPSDAPPSPSSGPNKKKKKKRKTEKSPKSELDKPSPDSGNQPAKEHVPSTQPSTSSSPPPKSGPRKKRPKISKEEGGSDEASLMKGAVEVLKNVLINPVTPSKASTSSPDQPAATSQHGQGPGSDDITDRTVEAHDGPDTGTPEGSGKSGSKRNTKKRGETTDDGSISGHNIPDPRSEGSPLVSKRRSGSSYTIERVNCRALELTPIIKPQPAVPQLAYGLDRVLFNPGVYHLQDPRSRVFNFDPYLASIMPISEFDFNALKQYVTSSKDNTLISMAQEFKKKYTGSTSSMTATLAHFHYLLSSWRPVNPAHTSRAFTPDSLNFTRINRAPSAAFLHWKDGTYAIDADKEFDTANVLSMLGKSMEKLLTLPKEEYEKYRRANSDQLTDEDRNGVESYHYTTMGDFMMRSQLDAFDRRVPGTGMFDLKTRAVVSIRMDAKDFHKGLGYEIRGRIGQWESFEREYFDMIRSAFLKYSLQVRMGRMDGIFVAFHNTQRIFGFQYVSLGEMDLAIHGTESTIMGDREFKLSLHLLNQVLDKATAKFPKQSLRLHLETRPTDPPFMYVFVKPVTPQDIDQVQNANRESVEAFERNMMGVARDEELPGEFAADEEDSPDELGSGQDLRDHEDDQSEDVWEDMLLKVEETMENDELGATSVREAIEDALEQSGLLRARSLEESRRYVDALLEAITYSDEITPPEGTTGNDMPEEVEIGGHDGENETDLQSPTRLLAGEHARPQVTGPDYSVELEDAPTASGVTGSEGPANDRESDQEDAETDGKNIADEQSASDDDLSLKDLIIRLAVQIREAPETKRITEIGEEVGDELTSDMLKLRKFERILSELTAKSREPQNGEAAVEAEYDAGSTEEASSRVSGSYPEKSEDTEDPAGTTGNTATPEAGEGPAETGPEEVLGMILTIRNKVDGKYVKRPENMHKKSSWIVEYTIQELPSARTARLYQQLQKRREALLRPKPKDNLWYKMFRGKLHDYSKKGRAFREKETRIGQTFPVNVYGVDQPLKWEEVFGDVESSDGAQKPPQAPANNSKVKKMWR